jgi:hypothetical protein
MTNWIPILALLLASIRARSGAIASSSDPVPILCDIHTYIYNIRILAIFIIIIRVVAKKNILRFLFVKRTMFFFSQICSFGQIDTTNKYKSLHTAGHYLSQCNAFLSTQDYLWAICMKQSDRKVWIVWECITICRGNLEFVTTNCCHSIEWIVSELR